MSTENSKIMDKCLQQIVCQDFQVIDFQLVKSLAQGVIFWHYVGLYMGVPVFSVGLDTLKSARGKNRAVFDILEKKLCFATCQMGLNVNGWGSIPQSGTKPNLKQ